MKKFTTIFTRSALTESSHSLKVLITDTNGKVLLTSQNENDLIYPRSSIKIFQAIPFIQSKAKEFYKLNPKKIALACSSHRGEKFHIKELKNWIIKIGITNKTLKCGIHNPLNLKASESLFRSNNLANELHNNCAGKHLAMVTTCKLLKYNINNYLGFDHPHQIKIRKIFETFIEKKIQKRNYGIDGCSAPQYSFKIKDIGKMLINLIKSYNGNFQYYDEVKLLIDSVIKNPKYIGGTDSLDSRIMMITNKKVFCKGGAEGVFIFIHLIKGISGIIKIEDGNERAIPSAVFEIFKKLRILSNSELNKLKKYYKFNITNHAKIPVGSIKTKL